MSWRLQPGRNHTFVVMGPGLRRGDSTTFPKFRLTFPQISTIFPVSPCRHEGRCANVTQRGAGCDGRLRRQALRKRAGRSAAAYGEIVWFWRRDPGATSAETIPPATGARKAAPRGDHV